MRHPFVQAAETSVAWTEMQNYCDCFQEDLETMNLYFGVQSPPMSFTARQYRDELT